MENAAEAMQTRTFTAAQNDRLSGRADKKPARGLRADLASQSWPARLKSERAASVVWHGYSAPQRRPGSVSRRAGGTARGGAGFKAFLALPCWPDAYAQSYWRGSGFHEPDAMRAPTVDVTAVRFVFAERSLLAARAALILSDSYHPMTI
jgi:hypothetical protein